MITRRDVLIALRSYAVIVETKRLIEMASYCQQALEKVILSFSLI